jgi:hypothetical protein
MLQPEFWLDRVSDPDAVLMGSDAIEAFNARVYEVLDIPHVFDLPDNLPRDDVVVRMAAYTPTGTLYTAEGDPAHRSFFEKRLKDAHPKSDPVPVRFGLVTQRTDVSAFPTPFVYTRDPFDFAFDRLQETTIDIGWPVAVVGEVGYKGKWLFCLTPQYWGWVRTAHIAIGTRAEAAYNGSREPFIVTIASRGLIDCCAPQMGTRLPLIEGSAGKRKHPISGGCVCQHVLARMGFCIHPKESHPNAPAISTRAICP